MRIQQTFNWPGSGLDVHACCLCLSVLRARRTPLGLVRLLVGPPSDTRLMTTKRRRRLEVRGKLSGAPLVTMMESADLRNRNDPPGFGRLDGPSLRRVLLQSQVCPGLMIVIEEISKVPVKTSFVEYNDVVQALAANGSDDPFDIRTLPGRAWRGQDLFDPVSSKYSCGALINLSNPPRRS
jgi:hypothetical protein